MAINFLNEAFTGKNLKLKLFTLQGELVSEDNYTAVDSSVSHISNGLAAGVYIVAVESEGYTKVSKLVVQ
ncbi:MAG: T9SS type A sorting domain-containing protein [Paludibacter sp.]|nr:T9SS type A sorting domain-containing protein [Paludibacter sp.]